MEREISQYFPYKVTSSGLFPIFAYFLLIHLFFIKSICIIFFPLIQVLPNAHKLLFQYPIHPMSFSFSPSFPTSLSPNLSPSPSLSLVHLLFPKLSQDKERNRQTKQKHS